MERSNNTLTANELRNDRDTMSAESAFIDGGTTQDERSVVHGTARSMTRKKLSIIISVAVVIVVLLLVILIPALGLRKNA